MASAALDRALVTSHSPVPISLRFVFRLTATLATPISIGDSGQGLRKVVPLTGGVLASKADGQLGEGAFDGAQCVAGGADYLTVDANGLSRLDARYVFQLKSGHFLYFQSSGTRYVPPGDEEASRLLGSGSDIDPKRYYFRLKLVLESDDEDAGVQGACKSIVVASAVRGATSIVYDAYVVT